MTDINATAAVPNAAATKSKVRQKSIVRFPYQVHAGITPAMNRGIEDLTANNSLIGVADIIRISVHAYLLANNPKYSSYVGGNNAS
jgi:hypothetical protein